MSNSIKYKLEKQRIDKEFNRFIRKEIKPPYRCKTLDEIRFYIDGIASMINGLEQKYGYVPNPAYPLLCKYNRVYNKIMFELYYDEFYYSKMKE